MPQGLWGPDGFRHYTNLAKHMEIRRKKRRTDGGIMCHAHVCLLKLRLRCLVVLSCFSCLPHSQPPRLRISAQRSSHPLHLLNLESCDSPCRLSLRLPVDSRAPLPILLPLVTVLYVPPARLSNRVIQHRAWCLPVAILNPAKPLSDGVLLGLHLGVLGGIRVSRELARFGG